MRAAGGNELQNIQDLFRYTRDTNGLGAPATVREIEQQLAEIRTCFARPESSERSQVFGRAANVVAWLRAPCAGDGATARFPPETASAAWLVYGQACEGMSGPAYLEEALRAYAEAIAACGGRAGVDRSPAPVRYAWALAWMNRGNALQRRGGAADLDAAVWAYDEAIATFEPLRANDGDSTLTTRNTLGAAWLNRGRALQGQATAASLRQAIVSYGCAISVLEGMPTAPNPWPLINLAAARMNLANASLALAAVAATDAAQCEAMEAALGAARAACAAVAPLEETVGVAAEVALQSRRVLACVLGECLARTDTSVPVAQRREWIADVGDAVENGLACVLAWEARGVGGFRPLATRLFRLGLQLYRVHQPQFLAEFVLELLDPAEAGDARWLLSSKVTLFEEAQAAIAGARVDLRTQHRIDLASEKTTRLLQVLAALDTAYRRLDELRLRS